jgi:aminomethyltransferase
LPKIGPATILGAVALRETPLVDEHRALNAKLIDFAGWLMPVEYRGLRLEHQACRAGVGLFDVSHMGEVRVRGEGALDALQWLTTNDVSRLEMGRAQYSLLPNERGGIVDDVIVYCLEPKRDYLVCVNASNAAKDFAWMRDHAAGSGTKQSFEITDESDRWAQIAVQGPRAMALVERLFGADARALAPFQFRAFAFGDDSVLVARTGYTGEDGVEIFTPPGAAPALWRALLAKGADLGVAPIGLGARDTLRTEMRYPLYGHEIDDETNPYAAGLGWVVKPNAKDFVGRGLMLEGRDAARARPLVGFKMIDRGIARQGYPISNEAGVNIGRVTSGTLSPSLNENIGVGYVSQSNATVGQTIFVEIRGKSIAARIVPTPFVNPVKA